MSSAESIENRHGVLKRLGLAAVIVAGLAACTWVKPTTEGAAVAVVPDAAAVEGCRKLGITRVSVLDRVAGVPRSYRKLEQELDTLARNSAAEMAGDTVMAASEIVDGHRTYAVYDCSERPPPGSESDGVETFPLQ